MQWVGFMGGGVLCELTNEEEENTTEVKHRMVFYKIKTTEAMYLRPGGQ